MTDPDAELRAWGPRPGEQTAPPEGDEPSGVMRLPGYSDFQRIAEGGEGVVYRARQDGLDRFVAVKVINVQDPARVARFRRELEITVRLGRQHPHVVTVLDTGTTPDGRPCIVMEYYDNGSLQDRLRERGPMPVEDVVAAGTAVADALAFAHAQGFLHRDVKPQNILVLPTSYVLADFGIARMADAANTTSLQMVSYRHAAPQTIDGADPSPSDDQWSLGSTLFTLLDGAPPFSSDNPDEDTVLSYLERVRATEPRQLRRSDVPPDLLAIITRCLSKRREDRFPDTGALRAALAGVRAASWAPAMPVDFGPRPAPPPPEPPPPPPPSTTDRDATVAGPNSHLAGLTVRMSDRPAVPDFGPAPTNYTPTNYPPPPADEPPVVAVLPAPTAWQPEPYTDPDPTTTIARPRTPTRRTGRRVLVAAAAVVVGGALGVFVVPKLLDGTDQAAPRTPPSTSRPTTTTATATPPPASVAGGDPAFAPTLNPPEDKGESVVLTWTDRTAGNAQFVVVDVTDGQRALATVAPGTYTYTVEDLDPGADQYCFQVIGLGLDDPTTQHGASESVCTDR